MKVIGSDVCYVGIIMYWLQVYSDGLIWNCLFFYTHFKIVNRSAVTLASQEKVQVTAQ